MKSKHLYEFAKQKLDEKIKLWGYQVALDIYNGKDYTKSFRIFKACIHGRKIMFRAYYGMKRKGGIGRCR